MQFIAVLNKAPSVYNQMLFPSTSHWTLTLPQQRMVEEKDTAGRKKRKNIVPCVGPTLTIFRRNCNDNPAKKSHIRVFYSQTNNNQSWLTDKILPWIQQDVMQNWRDEVGLVNQLASFRQPCHSLTPQNKGHASHSNVSLASTRLSLTLSVVKVWGQTVLTAKTKSTGAVTERLTGSRLSDTCCGKTHTVAADVGVIQEMRNGCLVILTWQLHSELDATETQEGHFTDTYTDNWTYAVHFLTHEHFTHFNILC